MTDSAAGKCPREPTQTKHVRRPSVGPVAAALFAAGTLLGAMAVGPPPFAEATPDSTHDNTFCAPGGFDSCYPEDQMGDFVATNQRVVDGYLTEVGVPSQSLPTVTFIPSATSALSQCVDQNGSAAQSDRAFNYCPADNSVYIGHRAVWDSYQQYGVAGPTSGLAHEYGHFLQDVAGVPNPHTAAETIGHENQADCVSGAFIGYVNARGDVGYPKDFDQLGRYLTATASAEGPGRDHGTATERIQSFEQGYAGALMACNHFYPATPLAP